MNHRRICPGCSRVFDLLDHDDASEWAYSHDCEDGRESMNRADQRGRIEATQGQLWMKDNDLRLNGILVGCFCDQTTQAIAQRTADGYRERLRDMADERQPYEVSRHEATEEE